MDLDQYSPLEQLALLKKPVFKRDELVKSIGFQYLEEILNLYVHRYLFSVNYTEFYLEYRGIHKGVPIVSSSVIEPGKSKTKTDYLRIPDYLNDPTKLYEATYRVVSLQKSDFADLCGELAGYLNMDYEATSNLFYSNKKFHLYLVYDFLLLKVRDDDVYSMFSMDKVISGSNI